MAAHAILSASSASRWMACPPSARLEQNFENTTSPYAAEGTLAHELGELNLRYKLKEINKRTYDSRVKKLLAHELFSADMPDYVEIYTNICQEKMSEAKAITPDARFSVEQRLNYSEWVPEGFGTGDFVIIADGTMEIIDLKYGKGVPVSAVENKQMRLYALGAISEFSFLYDIQHVKMTIAQPRLDNISTDEMTTADLLSWAENILRPVAELAHRGDGEFCAGAHCGFCRAKAVCRARAEKNMELAKLEFALPNTLASEEIADILGKAEELSKWAKDLQEYALEHAVSGEEFPGWKLVEGRSNRKYTDTNIIAKTLFEQGYSENVIYKPVELLGLTNLEKVVGKKRLCDLIGDYIEKPIGRPTLVPDCDKRPIFNSIKVDFE
jgi:hypothetical protein